MNENIRLVPVTESLGCEDQERFFTKSFIALVLLLSLFYTIKKNIKMTFRIFAASKIIPDLYLTTLWGVLSVKKTGGHKRRDIIPDCVLISCYPQCGPLGLSVKPKALFKFMNPGLFLSLGLKKKKGIAKITK